jgi:hypothetical protein
MSLPSIPLSKEDFVQAQWERVISECQDKKCEIYSTHFFDKAREAQEAGNTKSQAVFILLGGITSLMLVPDSSDEPFAPLAVFHNFRSIIVDDISDIHLDVLAELASEIPDAELRARIADIIWLRKRNYKMAQLAVSSYVESASNLEDSEVWIYFVERLERAIKLAAFLGKKNSLFATAVTYIENTLNKYNGEDYSFLSAKLMEILQEHRQGDPQKYIPLAEKAALRAESEQNWYKARSYWQVKAQWHSLEQAPESARNALISLAETFVREAEKELNKDKPSYLIASKHLENAIEAFKRIGKSKERIEELHKKLLNCQKQTLAEMKPIFGKSVDLSDCAERAREEVKGKEIHDALLKLASMFSPPSVSRLRQKVQESAKNFAFYHLMGGVFVNEMGKVIARKPSMGVSNPQETEEAIKDEMFTRARLEHQHFAQGVIEPARSQINLEHYLQIRDWMPIVANNPFVPPGREFMYARGFQAGLQGDFLVSVHLLIPQIENSIRYLLYQHDVITSRFSQQKLQDELLLHETLFLPEITDIFSEDILFALKGLLINRFGSNLRNRTAHGLSSLNECVSLDVSYLWCLTLHLCCIPILAFNSSDEQEELFEGKESDSAVNES